MTPTLPIDDALFNWPDDEPQLIGCECRDCGAIAFPRQSSCSRCTSKTMSERLLGRCGTLSSYTVHRFEPKASNRGPQPLEPYGVGYIELPGEVIVESRLTIADPDALEIGQPMELVVVPFGSGDGGQQLVTFAFQPAAGTDVTPIRW